MFGTVYIIGKIPKVISIKCTYKFKKAQLFLEEMGYSVINPIETFENETITLEETIRTNIKSLMRCDTVYIMACISIDESSNEEVLLALKLNKAIILSPCFLGNEILLIG